MKFLCFMITSIFCIWFLLNLFVIIRIVEQLLYLLVKRLFISSFDLKAMNGNFHPIYVFRKFQIARIRKRWMQINAISYLEQWMILFKGHCNEFMSFPREIIWTDGQSNLIMNILKGIKVAMQIICINVGIRVPFMYK